MRRVRPLAPSAIAVTGPVVRPIALGTAAIVVSSIRLVRPSLSIEGKSVALPVSSSFWIRSLASGLVFGAVRREMSLTAVARSPTGMPPSAPAIWRRMMSSRLWRPAGARRSITAPTASATSSAVATMLDSYDSSVSWRCISAARAGRSPGLRASAWWRMSSSRDGRPGRMSDARGNAISLMLRMMSSASSPGKSFSPVNSSKITDAAENRSLLVSS